MKKIIVTFFLSFIIFLSLVNFTKAKELNEIDYIIDNASMIEDRDSLYLSIQNLLKSQNIEAYVYSIKNATQESFEETMSIYDSSLESDFILFYLSKDNANIGIYVSDNLRYIISDATKSLLLKTMESFVAEEEYDKALIAAIGNLNEILNVQNSEIEHEVLDIEDKSLQRNTSLIFMILSLVVFLGFGIILVKSIRNDKRKEKENDSIQNK